MTSWHLAFPGITLRVTSNPFCYYNFVFICRVAVIFKLTHPARRSGHPLQGSWLLTAVVSLTEAAVCDAVVAAVALSVPDLAQAAAAANVKAAAPVVTSAAAIVTAAKTCSKQLKITTCACVMANVKLCNKQTCGLSVEHENFPTAGETAGPVRRGRCGGG